MAFWDDFTERFAQTQDWFYSSSPRKWLLFALLVAATWVLAAFLSRLLTGRLVRIRRIEPAVVHLLGRLFVFLSVLLGLFIYAYGVFEANVAGLAATFGLITLALGFGLQNTIANIAGGISLALDRPFRLGDQIKVGNYVGDVQEIGVRSTRILTRRKEYVVLPNKFLESEPITNYTMVYPEFRLDVPVNIANVGERERAEQIMVEVAVGHPVVLRRPAPRVLLRRFLGTVLQLELRCWISHPRSRNVVESDLLKSISDRFAADGIFVPQASRGRPTDGVATRAADRPSAFVRRTRTQKRILVPLVGSFPSSTRGAYVVGLAKALNAQIIGLYLVHGRHGTGSAEDGAHALHALELEADSAGIWFKPILRMQDDLRAAVADVASEEDVDLVVLGVDRTRGGLDRSWRRGGAFLTAAELVQGGVRAAIHGVPEPPQVLPRTVEALERSIAELRHEASQERTPPVHVSPPDPVTSGVPAPPPETPRAERAAVDETGENA